METYLHHTAIHVNDLLWYVNFLERALGMQVTRTEGPPEQPEQVWLDGGIQLIRKTEGGIEAGHLAHLGLACRDMAAAVRRVSPYAVGSCPQGDNWLELPEGIVLELMQAE